MTETKVDFMRRLKGIPSHQVAKALTRLAPGIVWTGCGKGYMADSWERANKNPNMSAYGALHKVTLDALVAKIAEMYQV